MLSSLFDKPKGDTQEDTKSQESLEKDDTAQTKNMSKEELDKHKIREMRLK
jgi:hypothetical protein